MIDGGGASQPTHHAVTGEENIDAATFLNPPTLIIHDPLDPMAPVDHVEWFVSLFPHCERVAVRAAGHLIWAGPDAERMHEARVRFLREHVSAGKRRK